MGWVRDTEWTGGHGSSELCAGMSVRAVSLAGERWYLAGAPRSRDRGAVLLFSHGERGSGQLNVRHVITGHQFGAGFGYDLVVDDFNLDG